MTAKLLGFTVPESYDPIFFTEILLDIQHRLENLELPYIILIPQHVEPGKLIDGIIANADGTDWNPGSGAGLYEYVSGAWSKL